MSPNACPLCGSPDLGEPLATHSDAGVLYTLYPCHACAGQFWWPFKNPGASWYEHDERYADRNRDPILKPNEKHTGVMSAMGKSGRVLDVGCGVGNFLALARAQGWECWGIDFDQDAIEAGKATFGLEHLEVADLGEFKARHPNLTFDLITFFDVFEHLDNHDAFLTDVAALLSPGGAIALSVPYRHGWRWLMPHDVPPRHLTRWDEPSVTNILSRHGFMVTRLRRLPATFWFIVMKLRFRYGKWASLGLMRRVKGVRSGEGNAAPAPAGRVEAVHTLARLKDLVLFGIPAGLVYLALLFTRKRYTDFYVIARNR